MTRWQLEKALKSVSSVKRSVQVSEVLTAKLAESKKSLKTARAEVALLKEQVERADPEKVDSHKLVAEVCEESKQRLVRLNVAIVGRNRAWKLAHALVTESVNAVDAVVQQLGYDAASRLRQGLERAYSTVRVP